VFVGVGDEDVDMFSEDVHVWAYVGSNSPSQIGWAIGPIQEGATTVKFKV
jgi:hypothetical protein